jgi:ubiquitin thioesterase OTU1
MLLKIQKDSLSVKVEVKDNAPFSSLAELVSAKLSVNLLEADIMIGYPPKVICARDDELLPDLGIIPGSVLTVRANPKKKELHECLKSMGFADSVCRPVMSKVNTTTTTQEEVINMAVEQTTSSGGSAPSPGVARKIIAADNSCMLNAIGYLVLGGDTFTTDFNPMLYRKAVADAVQHDTATYSSEMLGRPPAEYAAWIMNSDKWGGEIELHALSKHLGMEIAAVDIRTGNLLVYGEQQASSGAAGGTHPSGRIYVLYDGVHYDAVVREKSPLPGGAEVTVFKPDDKVTEREVLELARTLRESKQFVNLSTGCLQCKECFAAIDGEAAAVEHAKRTGHKNFGQV